MPNLFRHLSLNITIKGKGADLRQHDSKVYK